MIAIGSKFTHRIGSFTRHSVDGSFSSAMEFPSANMAQLQRALLTTHATGPRPIWHRILKLIGVIQ